MMTFVSRALTLAVFLLISPITLAEQTYKVNELLDLAIKHNPELRAIRLEAKAHRADAKQASLWDDPNLEVGGQKQAKAGETNFANVSLSQMIPRPGRLGAKEAAALREADIGDLTQEISEISLRNEVLRLIYRYKVAFEKSHHAKERYDRFKTVSTYLRSRPFAAPQKRAETVIVRSKLLVLQKELRELEAERIVAWNELNLYLALAAEPSISAPWYKQPEKLQLSELQKLGETKNPELRKQSLTVAQTESEAKLAHYESWPGLTLRAGYGDGRGFEPEKDYSLGVSFSLPLWNANRGNIESAQFRSSAERERLAWARERFAQNLKSALQVYNAVSQSLVELSPNLIPNMEKDMATIDSGFKKGQVDLITYLESDAQHVGSLNAVFDSQIDYLTALGKLLILVGEAPKALEE